MKKTNLDISGKLKITAYGAAEEVGRSSFILEDDEHTVLLEAGIKLQPEGLSLAPEGLKERAGEIDVAVLSHAHVDHSGYLPALWQNGYHGKLFMTEPTFDIVSLLWQDHYKIEGSRHWSKNGLEGAMENTVTLKYRQRTEIADGIFIEFYNSGHILGAAMILIDWKGTKILYTGDINDQQTPLFDGFDMPDCEVDILITESTNGVRKIKSRQEVNKEFQREIIAILESGKKVIIPSFAVGRSQEILTVLTEVIKSYPIYVDGMINKMIEITKKYLNPFWVDEPILNRLRAERRENQFEYDNIFQITRENYDHTGDFRKFIGKSSEPCIIVTTSGMFMPSPVHTHLYFAGTDKGNLIAVTGYQAEGTLGRDIIEGKRRVTLSTGRNRTSNVHIKAKIKRFGFSGHVSSEGIADLIAHTKPKQIILMHGDPENQIALGKKLENGIIPGAIKIKVPLILNP
ncbi:MAG: MBL fold metallo-hydrolase [Candidatus Heimdallarchaeota archaeon]|nr:MBL fold metallo-hydrolase [Candidatus Heimdallarchaeota archaeon]